MLYNVPYLLFRYCVLWVNGWSIIIKNFEIISLQNFNFLMKHFFYSLCFGLNMKYILIYINFKAIE